MNTKPPAAEATTKPSGAPRCGSNAVTPQTGDGGHRSSFPIIPRVNQHCMNTSVIFLQRVWWTGCVSVVSVEAHTAWVENHTTPRTRRWNRRLISQLVSPQPHTHTLTKFTGVNLINQLSGASSGWLGNRKHTWRISSYILVDPTTDLDHTEPVGVCCEKIMQSFGPNGEHQLKRQPVFGQVSAELIAMTVSNILDILYYIYII